MSSLKSGRAHPQHLQLGSLTMEDLQQVLPIEQQCFGGYWSQSIFETELKTKGCYYVKLQDLHNSKDILAYGGFWQIFEEAHLTTLAVDPQYQGIGLGALLLGHLMTVAQIQEAHWMTLEVRPSNQQAIKLYQRYGFGELGRRKGYYPDNEDALLFWYQNLHLVEARKCLEEHHHQCVAKLKTQGIELSSKNVAYLTQGELS
jgi:[ribosomal protein S18]-alanine N-acetyltransferase